MTITIKNIFVGDRQRSDLGDIEELAASIREHGLIEPIVVDENLRLIAGRRRLEACILLGWVIIPAVTLNGLNEFQKQAIELEEDLRRKDRTWWEKCLAVELLFKIKKTEHGEFGEAYSIRMLEEQTCFKKSHLAEMLRLAEEIRAHPNEAKRLASQTEAFKQLVIMPKEAEVQAELERRAARASLSAVRQPDTTDDEADSDTTMDDYGVAVETLIKVKLHGFDRAIGPKDYDTYDYALVFDPDDGINLIEIGNCIRPQGAIILWTRSRFEPWFSRGRYCKFDVMPWPLIWQWQPGMPQTSWPFSPNYANGIVMFKNKLSTPKPHPDPANSVITCLTTDYSKLPMAVVHHSLSAMALPETPILLPCNAEPVAVADAGFIPVWFEPDPALFKAKQDALVAYYQIKYPNAEIIL